MAVLIRSEPVSRHSSYLQEYFFNSLYIRAKVSRIATGDHEVRYNQPGVFLGNARASVLE